MSQPVQIAAGVPQAWGVGHDPDNHKVLLMFETPYGQLAFALEPDMIEGKAGSGSPVGIADALRQAVPLARTGLVKAGPEGVTIHAPTASGDGIGPKPG